jgi:hypothetical protein
MPGVNGLYAAVGALFICWLWGSSRELNVGPESVVAIMDGHDLHTDGCDRRSRGCGFGVTFILASFWLQASMDGSATDGVSQGWKDVCRCTRKIGDRIGSDRYEDHRVGASLEQRKQFRCDVPAIVRYGAPLGRVEVGEYIVVGTEMEGSKRHEMVWIVAMPSLSSLRDERQCLLDVLRTGSFAKDGSVRSSTRELK